MGGTPCRGERGGEEEGFNDEFPSGTQAFRDFQPVPLKDLSSVSALLIEICVDLYGKGGVSSFFAFLMVVIFLA